MATEHWDLKCAQCPEHLGLPEISEKAVLALLKVRDEAAKVHNVFSREVDFGDKLEMPHWVRFFGEHAAHRILAVSEYGYLAGDCRADHPVEFHEHVCSLAAGHQGEHVWRYRWTY